MKPVFFGYRLKNLFTTKWNWKPETKCFSNTYYWHTKYYSLFVESFMFPVSYALLQSLETCPFQRPRTSPTDFWRALFFFARFIISLLSTSVLSWFEISLFATWVLSSNTHVFYYLYYISTVITVCNTVFVIHFRVF